MRLSLKLISVLSIMTSLTGCSGAHGKNDDPQELDAADASAIFGGSVAQETDLVTKSTVLIAKSTIGNGFCSGTLIGRTTVLTAAHCVEAYISKPETLHVRFGALGSKGFRKVTQMSLHPSFVRNPGRPTLKTYESDTDLAILRLEGFAPPEFEPVSIPAQTDSLKDFKKDYSVYFNAGFGRTALDKPDSFGKLRLAKHHENELSIELNTIQVKSKDKQSCVGDSGGPLFGLRESDQKLELIGVHSTGDCQSYQINASLHRHSDWVRQALDPLEAGCYDDYLFKGAFACK